MQKSKIETLENGSFRKKHYEKYLKSEPPYWKRVDWQTHPQRQWQDYHQTEEVDPAQTGLQIQPIGQFIKENKEDLYYSRYGLEDYFRHEVYALYNRGQYIRVESGKKIKQPVFINYFLEENNPTLIDFNVIHLEEGAELSVIINYQSLDQTSHYRNSVLKVFLGQNAKLKLCRVQNLNIESLSYDYSDFALEASSHVDYYSVEFGGKVNAVSSTAYLNDYKASINMAPAYLSDGVRKSDLAYSVIFKGQQSKGLINGNGAVQGQARKVFRGNIYFERGSAQSVGREGSLDILLDPSIKSHSIPTLFCDEDDVIGEHYASVGRIDEKKLLYLMSRGISEEKAKKIVVESAFRPVIDQIDHDQIKKDLYEQLERRIS